MRVRGRSSHGRATRSREAGPASALFPITCAPPLIHDRRHVLYPPRLAPRGHPVATARRAQSARPRETGGRSPTRGPVIGQPGTHSSRVQMHSRPHAATSSNRLRALGVLLLLLLLPRTIRGPVVVQTHGSQPAAAEMHEGSVGITSASWRGDFDDEAACLLRNGPGARMRVLNEIVEVARRDERETDLSATGGPLIHAAIRDSRLERRLKAVEALTLIGADGVFGSLYRATSSGVARLFGIAPNGGCPSETRQA